MLSWLVSVPFGSVLFVALGAYAGASAGSAAIVPQGELRVIGDLAGDDDLSALESLGADGKVAPWIIASDETTKLQLLLVDGDHRRVRGDLHLLPEGSTEVDFEALAYDDGVLYALGSHSWIRKKTKSRKPSQENRERLATVFFEASRDHLFRIEVDPQSGQVLEQHSSRGLRTLIANHPVLHRFGDVPSKENGVDFEGLAVTGERLLLGLRGPVLRGNWVPVLDVTFDAIDDCSLAFEDGGCRTLYVDLGGLGIRSLESVGEGYLLIAGPVGDAKLPSQLYFWDGLDCLPDDDRRACRLEHLGEIPTPKGAKPEGLMLLSASSSAWKVVVLYDSVEGGAPTVFTVDKPSRSGRR